MAIPSFLSVSCHLARAMLVGGVSVALVLAASPSSAAEDGIRNLHGAEKRAFYKNVGWDPPYNCSIVGVSRANERWAITTSSFKCGPASGHSYVYKLRKDGRWRFLFYDMEQYGCDKFKMPAAVRADFYPYVC